MQSGSWHSGQSRSSQRLWHRSSEISSTATPPAEPPPSSVSSTPSAAPAWGGVEAPAVAGDRQMPGRAPDLGGGTQCARFARLDGVRVHDLDMPAAVAVLDQRVDPTSSGRGDERYGSARQRHRTNVGERIRCGGLDAEYAECSVLSGDEEPHPSRRARHREGTGTRGRRGEAAGGEIARVNDAHCVIAAVRNEDAAAVRRDGDRTGTGADRDRADALRIAVCRGLVPGVNGGVTYVERVQAARRPRR